VGSWGSILFSRTPMLSAVDKCVLHLRTCCLSLSGWTWVAPRCVSLGSNECVLPLNLMVIELLVDWGWGDDGEWSACDWVHLKSEDWLPFWAKKWWSLSWARLEVDIALFPTTLGWCITDPSEKGMGLDEKWDDVSFPLDGEVNKCS